MPPRVLALSGIAPSLSHPREGRHPRGGGPTTGNCHGDFGGAAPGPGRLTRLTRPQTATRSWAVLPPHGCHVEEQQPVLMALEVNCVPRSLRRRARARSPAASSDLTISQSKQRPKRSIVTGYDIDISLMNWRHHRNAFSRVSAANVSDLPSVIHSSEAWAV
jgi:hypothetical protein